MAIDEGKIRRVLTDTVLALCPAHCVKVEGLLGITLDDSEIILVNINEKLQAGDLSGKPAGHKRKSEDCTIDNITTKRKCSGIFNNGINGDFSPKTSGYPYVGYRAEDLGGFKGNGGLNSLHMPVVPPEMSSSRGLAQNRNYFEDNVPAGHQQLPTGKPPAATKSPAPAGLPTAQHKKSIKVENGWENPTTNKPHSSSGKWNGSLPQASSGCRGPTPAMFPSGSANTAMMNALNIAGLPAGFGGFPNMSGGPMIPDVFKHPMAGGPFNPYMNMMALHQYNSMQALKAEKAESRKPAVVGPGESRKQGGSLQVVGGTGEMKMVEVSPPQSMMAYAQTGNDEQQVQTSSSDGSVDDARSLDVGLGEKKYRTRRSKEFQRFRCSLCGASSGRKFNLQRHLKSHHPGFGDSYITDLTPKKASEQGSVSADLDGDMGQHRSVYHDVPLSADHLAMDLSCKEKDSSSLSVYSNESGHGHERSISALDNYPEVFDGEDSRDNMAATQEVEDRDLVMDIPTEGPGNNDRPTEDTHEMDAEQGDHNDNKIGYVGAKLLSNTLLQKAS